MSIIPLINKAHDFTKKEPKRPELFFLPTSLEALRRFAFVCLILPLNESFNINTSKNTCEIVLKPRPCQLFLAV